MQTVVVKQGYKSCENTLNIQLLWFIHLYMFYIHCSKSHEIYDDLYLEAKFTPSEVLQAVIPK